MAAGSPVCTLDCCSVSGLPCCPVLSDSIPGVFSEVPKSVSLVSEVSDASVKVASDKVVAINPEVVPVFPVASEVIPLVVNDDSGVQEVFNVGEEEMPQKKLRSEGCFILCPICDASFHPTSFWGHINNFHIARNVWPESSFIKEHHRLICSSCKFCYDERWIRSGCRRALGSGKRCGGSLCPPSVMLSPSTPLHNNLSPSASQFISVPSSTVSVICNSNNNNDSDIVNNNNNIHISTCLPPHDLVLAGVYSPCVHHLTCPTQSSPTFGPSHHYRVATCSSRWFMGFHLPLSFSKSCP